jgi:hypothetical protein
MVKNGNLLALPTRQEQLARVELLGGKILRDKAV